MSFCNACRPLGAELKVSVAVIPSCLKASFLANRPVASGKDLTHAVGVRDMAWAERGLFEMQLSSIRCVSSPSFN